MLCKHEKNYISSREGKEFSAKVKSPVRVGGFAPGNTAVKKLFCWGDFKSAMESIENRNFLIDPVPISVAGNARYRLQWA